MTKGEEYSKIKGIVGESFPVLDDGFVRLVDYMGDDSAIVQAARISYGKGTKQVSQDRALIRYLMRNRHTTPFEMCELKLHVRVPMDCWRQWIRHRTANVNEYSTRYSEAISSAHTTESNHWRMQDSGNRQGSDDCLHSDIGERLSAAEIALHEDSKKVYQQRLDAGVAREQARKDLPLSTYTEAYWKIDLHNLFHFLSLRNDSHAQLEIQNYAKVIGEKIVQHWCPLAWEAFVDYVQDSISLSKVEQAIIQDLARGNNDLAISTARAHEILQYDDTNTLTKNRERFELERKLSGLGFLIPW